MKSFLLGLILGLAALPIAAYVYLKAGHPPVATADRPFPLERQFVRAPLHARIQAEMPQGVPIQPTDANLEAGARIYHDRCAVCHGFYGHPSSFAKYMYPHAPQLWERHHRNKAVGVSDDPPGETWWKVNNGIRLTGMPAFDKILNSTQIWQVSLLLSRADRPLPPDVLNLLREAPVLNPTALVPSPKTAGTPRKTATLQPMPAPGQD
ncbi:MAG: cytochrome c [Acidobacteriaceae bacterium]